MVLLLKLCITFILSFIILKILIRYSNRLGFTDIPNKRSSHKIETPTAGGIAIGISFFTSFFFLEETIFMQNYYIFISIIIVFIVGILDDHKDIKPKVKFYIIFTATIILCLNEVKIDSLGQYFQYELNLWYFSIPFTLFAISGFTNAMNLIDGLDGLATSIALSILITFAYIGSIFNDILIFNISIFLIASLCAFLVLNWNPAKIFMGDAGSLTLGFGISILGVLSLNYIHPIAILYIAAIPVLDTIIVMYRRLSNGNSPFRADKTHIHHILYLFFKKKVKQTVIFLFLNQLLFCLIGFVSAIHISRYPESPLTIILFFGFIIICIIKYMVLSNIKRRQDILEKIFLRNKRNRNK